jgi:hypothetical protein
VGLSQKAYFSYFRPLEKSRILTGNRTFVFEKPVFH